MKMIHCLILIAALILGALPALAQDKVDMDFLATAKSLGDPCLKAMEAKQPADYVDTFCMGQYEKLLVVYGALPVRGKNETRVFSLYGSTILQVLFTNEMFSNGGMVSGKLCSYGKTFTKVAAVNSDWSDFAPGKSIQSVKEIVDNDVLPICNRSKKK